MKQIYDKKTGLAVLIKRMSFHQVYDYAKERMPKNSRWIVMNGRKTREYFWHYVSEYIGYKLCWIYQA